MSATAIHRPRFTTYGARNHHNYQTVSNSFNITLTMKSKSSWGFKKQGLSAQLQENSVSHLQTTSRTHLQFDQLQPVNQLFAKEKKLDFGHFVAHEAVLDEEYWTAAWLRAETHWEDRQDDRYADSYKRKFAEQEFNALKRQCTTKGGWNSACIVTVKKEEENERHTSLRSVVGTLDVSIRPFLHGETFPGEKVKAPIFYSTEREVQKRRYGYIANLCVAKSARRQGIARNMLHFSIQSVISNGVDQVYVHVHRKNIAAQELYQKIGFEVVDLANTQLSGEKTYLLRYVA